MMEALIREVKAVEGGLIGRCELPRSVRMQPGQYLQARCTDVLEPLPTSLFVMGWVDPTWFGFIPSTWLAGMTLHLRGPLGNGFALPAGCQHVGIMTTTGCYQRLAPAALQALKLGMAVTILGGAIPEGLPAIVEVLPEDDLGVLLELADLLIVEARLDDLPILRQRVYATAVHKIRSRVQVLVNTPMPCGGKAACGICSVPGRKADLLVCKDGPVLPLEDMAP
jgi:hypothetical protein